MDLYLSYEKLYNLSQKQKKVLQGDDYDQLLSLLSKKRELMEKIDKIDIKEYLNKQNNPQVALDRLQQLIVNIKEIDVENQKKMQKRKDNLAAEILNLNTKEKTNRVYQGEKKYEAKFIDKKK